jgi:uncharacterized membrane protein YbhN (UPF0104 family)
MTGARGALVRWLLRAAVLAVLAVLLIRVGAAPFLAGVQRLTVLAILTTVGLTAGATLLSAWRWTLVSRALGSPLPLGAAVGSYYRSQLVNTVLPGGVAGDVERGLRTGGAPGRRLHGLRVVAWDRAAAQGVQLAVSAGILLAFDTPLRPAGAVLGALLGVLTGGLLLAGRVRRGRQDGRLRRAAVALRRDLRGILGRPRTLLLAVAASALVALLHASVFVLAAVVAGAAFDPVRLLPLAIAVQVAMVAPVGFGGLGAREGTAAVVFAGAGLGAAQGVTAAIAYGALALIAVLPGVVPLMLTRLRPSGTRPPRRLQEKVAR